MKTLIVNLLWRIGSELIRAWSEKRKARAIVVDERLPDLDVGSTFPVITLDREYHDGYTLGEWRGPKGFECLTIELPWRDNAKNVSCIPEGRYILRKRPSKVVCDTTKGEYEEGWEVTGVGGRSLIMVHVGNTVKDILGCIAPGDRAGIIGGMPAVLNSLVTFRRLMKEMDEEAYYLDIRRKTE